AIAAARSSGAALFLARAALAMSRCLFWRGRFGDAEQALSAVAGNLGPQLAVQVAAEQSRNAVGLGDLGRAIGCAVEAVEHAEKLGDGGLHARALGAAAFAHLAIGDVDAVERDGSAWLAAAHRTRDPLGALRARLLLAEAARRKGRRTV